MTSHQNDELKKTMKLIRESQRRRKHWQREAELMKKEIEDIQKRMKNRRRFGNTKSVS